MKKGFVIASLIASLMGTLIGGIPAMAGEGFHGACKGDVEKFCKDVKVGEGRMRQCLREHRSELSDQCKERIHEAKERREACHTDREKFCKGVKPGGGRIRECMKAHQSELSQGCRTAQK